MRNRPWIGYPHGMHKQFCRAAALAIAGLLASCGGPSGPVDGARAMAHVEKLVAFGPRPAGSEALGKAADYIAAELAALGLSVRRQEFTPPGERVLLRNLWTQIDGPDPAKGPILCIGAHYDTKLADGEQGRKAMRFLGAIDGAGGPAVLLELARVLVREHKPTVNIWLYFIDGEESIDWDWGEGERALLGSRHFVKSMQADKTLFPDGLKARMKAFVLLDLIGSKDMKLDRDGNSSTDLQDLLLDAAKELGIEDRVYRYNASRGFGDDHQSFGNYGIPSVNLIDFMYRVPGDPLPPGKSYLQWWHTEDDCVSNMSADSLALAGNLVVKALPALERFCLPR
ncbi:MAG: M28 family peptidase [Planctomycetota bacterium]